MENTKTRTLTRLAQLQNWLRWVITHPKGVQAALAENNPCEPKPRMLESIVDIPPIPQQVRLDIYAEAYFARLLEVLSIDFEYLKKVVVAELGLSSFRKMVADYLVKNPSTYKCIGDVGRKLPEFLKDYEFMGELPFLSELAQLEAICLEASYYATLPGFDLAKLTSLKSDQWAGLRFELEPSLQILETLWPVHRIWNNEADLNFRTWTKEKIFTVVFRNAEWVYVRPVNTIQVDILKWMRTNESLGKICEKIEKNLEREQDPPPVMEWFRQWLGCGMIKNIESPS